MAEPVEMDPVDRITVGTIGPLGKRTFLLQARQGGRVFTVKMEKAQVAALVEYLGKLVSQGGRPGELPEEMELEDPQEPEWTVGTVGISYDESTDRFLLVIEEAAPEDAQGDSARLGASREQVAALAIRGTVLVEAGRPPCPLCGFPLDPSGHTCPKTNGHRPPAT